jgi:hypothetical protein
LFAHRDPLGEVQLGDLFFDTQVENTVLSGGLEPHLCVRQLSRHFTPADRGESLRDAMPPKKTFSRDFLFWILIQHRTNTK